jgi:RHS repeat-associated protein
VSFHGKEADATGLQYFGARYYDPVLGRFLGVDPAGFDEGNVHSVNRYAYGNNNPYRFRDPDGRQAAFIVPLGLAAAALYIASAHRPPTLAGYGSRGRSSSPESILFNENAQGAGEDRGRSCPNPDGCKGKQDHQDGVKGAADRARGEAQEGEQVLEGRKLQGYDSNRKPDVQIVNTEGRARQVYEVERHPTRKRNREREAEYDRLDVPHETIPLSGGN